MIHVAIKTLAFEPMSWAEWRLQYRQDIRVLAWTSALDNVKTGIHVCTPNDRLVLPHFDQKDKREVMKRTPIEVRIGERPVLVRLPALSIGKLFLVLDGCHRLKELRPALVVLDCAVPTKRQARMFSDLQLDWWRKRIR